jgi:hypothetical protein
MKALNKLTLMTMLFSAASCSQFLTHRDYLSEMQHDDSTFFKPREDFPVMVGDTGRDWETNSERMSRTPASVSDLQEEKSRSFLQHELKTLESNQSEEGAKLYDDHKHKFATTSERIYFLTLSHFEKRDYLGSRGFLKSQSATQEPDGYREMFGVRETHVAEGMTKSDVESNWGSPSRVEVAGNPSYENERWLYVINGATKYIYFEAGRVQGWE